MPRGCASDGHFGSDQNRRSPYAGRMTPRPDLDHLDALLLVAQKGSIGRAAAELRMSQPNLSRRLAALETKLGVQLLHRSRQGATLTQAGRVVAEWAFALLHAADGFSQSVSALQQRNAASVRVAVSMTIAEHYASDWVAQLRRRSPEYVVSLMVHNSTEVAELVESGAADIGFLESPTFRSGLRRRKIGWDDLAVAVAPHHAWAGRDNLSAAELAATPLLLREGGSGTRETVERALGRLGLEVSLGLAMASNTALSSAAVAGIGPVVLSELALRREFASGQLIRVAVHDLQLRRPLSAVWRHAENPSAGAAAILAVAKPLRRDESQPAN